MGLPIQSEFNTAPISPSSHYHQLHSSRMPDNIAPSRPHELASHTSERNGALKVTSSIDEWLGSSLRAPATLPG